MLYQALVKIAIQGVALINGYSLFIGCNAQVIFELAPQRASQLELIFVVIKHQCRITMFQFYA
ncbi:hypothetical protein PCNPT3_01690 [Psychromonas sp. CNPT3]|nr:hypothetical protein PCNPT3_01690 [Psychromonas sp. CNPT3]